ncbi:hypothetical protein D3C87_1477970 [compost metagenome]
MAKPRLAATSKMPNSATERAAPSKSDKWPDTITAAKVLSIAAEITLPASCSLPPREPISSDSKNVEP